MLHRFFEPGDWFAAKRYGYGAGLPITWQGWVLLASYLALMLGLVPLLTAANGPGRITALGLMISATALFTIICAKRTQGGWKWRWGKRD